MHVSIMLHLLLYGMQSAHSAVSRGTPATELTIFTPNLTLDLSIALETTLNPKGPLAHPDLLLDNAVLAAFKVKYNTSVCIQRTVAFGFGNMMQDSVV